MGYDVLKKAVLAEHTLISSRQTRFIVDLRDIPVYYAAVRDMDFEHLRLTNGLYTIRYDSPNGLLKSGAPRTLALNPFTIGTDLLGFHLTVKSVQHFKYLAKYIPEVAWMIRNTNYCDELFDVARQCIGICVPFSLNVGEYNKKLKRKAHDDGIRYDKTFNGFASYRCSESRDKIFTKRIPASPPISVYKQQLADALRYAEKYKEYEYKTVNRPNEQYVPQQSDLNFLGKKGFDTSGVEQDIAAHAGQPDGTGCGQASEEVKGNNTQ